MKRMIFIRADYSLWLTRSFEVDNDWPQVQIGVNRSLYPITDAERQRTNHLADLLRQARAWVEDDAMTAEGEWQRRSVTLLKRIDAVLGGLDEEQAL